jgi:hypothetical protein
MKLSWNKSDGYVLALVQDELNFIITSLILSTTHVSDSEYEIIIGRPKNVASKDVHDLADQADEVYQQRVREELEGRGAISAAIRAMGDLSVLPEDQVMAKIRAEASARGRAVEDADRHHAIVSEEKIASLVGELLSRRADVAGFMRSMLKDDDPGVQLTAAEQLLAIDPMAGKSALESLAVKRYPHIAYSAVLALRKARA